MNNNQQQNIDRYLNNEMLEAEQTAFETELQNDEALRHEVAFQRGFVGFMGRYRPSLEDKLDALGSEYILDAPKKKSYILWVILGVLLLCAILFYTISSNKKTSTIDVNTNSKSTIEIPEEAPIQIPIIEKDTIESNEENLIPSTPKNDKIKSTEESQKFDNQPIASIDESLYERNPNMELLLQGTVRANNDVQLLTIVEPVNDAVITTKNLTNFSINGTATTTLNYDIIIFNNKDFNINNNYPILKIAGKSIQELSENKIKFNAKLLLEKGLYYLIIQRENSRDILHISRFEVR